MPSKGEVCEKSTVISANDKTFNEAIAARIQRYWKSRGYDVAVNVSPTYFSQAFRGVRHEIESDMINGYPKGFKHG